MNKKWVILAALVFMGVVGLVVATSPKVYSVDEFKAAMSGNLDSGWKIFAETTGFHEPSRNIFRMFLDRHLGISGSAGTGGLIYELRNGEERAGCLVIYEGNNVEEISLDDSMVSRDLMREIQRKLPGIRCRIDSP